MISPTVEKQAKIYVYDLNNCANEYGFKAAEGWELSPATAIEKAEIEKKYYPTLAVKVLPEGIKELFNLVKSKLVRAAGVDKELETAVKFNKNQEYLIAFNPGRLR